VFGIGLSLSMISILFYFHFHIVFAIILEYSFYLWDPAPSSSIKYLTSAVNVYKSSGKHVIVTAAVEKIFEEEKEFLFGEVEDIENSGESTFAQKLVQIATENRLCMVPLCIGEFYLSDLYFSSFTLNRERQGEIDGIFTVYCGRERAILD
jgi:hypothetical protein